MIFIVWIAFIPLEQKKKLHKKVFEELCNAIMPLEEY